MDEEKTMFSEEGQDSDEISNMGMESKEKLDISSRKLEIPREHSCKDGYNKGQKMYGLNRSRRH